MSLRDRISAARKNQDARKSGLPKINPDNYNCLLMGATFGTSKNGNEMYTLSFQIRSGEETGKEFAQEKFNIFLLENQGWAMDILYVALEDMGVSLDWLESQKSERDAILSCLEAAIGAKNFIIHCARNKKDEKRNQYYLNDVPSHVLADEEPFGVDLQKEAPKEEEPKEEKPKAKKPAAKKEAEPEAKPTEEEWPEDDDGEW